MEQEKSRVEAWVRDLCAEIVTAFENLEDSQSKGPFAGNPPGRFEVRDTKRGDGNGGSGNGGGGVMSSMRDGRVFEKVGVNISTVHGELGPAAQNLMATQKNLPAIIEDARFWACGISLVAHMQNPHTPAVHMNTRMFWTPHGWWFGGGMDLNPCLEYKGDTDAFHGVLKAHCDAHGAALYQKYKDWADRYFFIPHRNRARGVGGIFFDDLNTGDWEADFAFTCDTGRAFLRAFLPVTEKRRNTPWTDAQKEAQLIHRGLYAEYNLIYDRGTRFGLETGHDPDAVLMSLPPLAKWT